MSSAALLSADTASEDEAGVAARVCEELAAVWCTNVSYDSKIRERQVDYFLCGERQSHFWAGLKRRKTSVQPCLVSTQKLLFRQSV